MDNLILTGWFWKDYAVAAAVALRHYRKADIYGVSTHRLPEMLNEVGNKYKEIATPILPSFRRNSTNTASLSYR